MTVQKGIYRKVTLTKKSRHFDLGAMARFSEFFAEDDASCLPSGYLPEIGKTMPPPSTSSEQFRMLDKKFKLSAEARKFLKNKPFLADALLIALSPLRSAFGGRYKLTADVLDEGHSSKLFITIPSKRSVEDSVAALGRFDTEWWFNQSPRIRGLMEFTLEFK